MGDLLDASLAHVCLRLLGRFDVAAYGLAVAQGSYLLHWRAIAWLKAHGCQWYDLRDIDQDENPRRL